MAKALEALISIHDVAPSTLARVQTILRDLPAACHDHLTLLVIPGKHWSPTDIDQLQQWQHAGYRLAGHGWHHQAECIGGIYHRLHAAILSRSAAEHLALDGDQILDLIRRNYAWFEGQGLAAPDYYVPPAWAMGAVSHEALRRETPYRFFEVTPGIYDAQQNRFKRLPLAGFEADTLWRQWSLAGWNQCNRMISGPGRPLRLGIHPDDQGLRLAGQLKRWAGDVLTPHCYRKLFDAPGL